MNCNDFENSWSGLVCKSIDDETRGAMAAHAKICEACAGRWSLQQDVDDTLQRLVAAQPLAANTAEKAANHAYQSRFGAVIDFGKSERTVVNQQYAQSDRWPRNVSLLIAFVAAVFGYLLGSGRSEPNLVQQLYSAQRMYGGRGGGNPYELMMISEMSGFGGGFLPNVTSTIHVLCLATILVWVTRSKLWSRVFPSKLPPGLHAARWLGLIAALVGIARSLGYAYATFTVRSMSGGRGTARDDLSWITNSLSVLDQLWGIGFWLTIIILVITVFEQLVQGVLSSDMQTTPVK